MKLSSCVQWNPVYDGEDFLGSLNFNPGFQLSRSELNTLCYKDTKTEVA